MLRNIGTHAVFATATAVLVLVYCDTSRAEPPTRDTAPTAAYSDGGQRVNVTGRGSTAPEARRDGWRAAVTEVVGTLVTSQTLVENQRLVEDTVMTLSRGFVTSYDEVAVRRLDGLIEIDMNVIVAVSAVSSTLTKAGVPVRSVDGKSLSANIATQQTAISEGRDAVIGAFRPFAGWGLAVPVVGEPAVTVRDGQALISVDARAEPDDAAYTSSLEHLRSVLRVVGIPGDELTDVRKQSGERVDVPGGAACGRSNYETCVCLAYNTPSKSASQEASRPAPRGSKQRPPANRTPTRNDCYYLQLDKYKLTLDDIFGSNADTTAMRVILHQQGKSRVLDSKRVKVGSAGLNVEVGGEWNYWEPMGYGTRIGGVQSVSAGPVNRQVKIGTYILVQKATSQDIHFETVLTPEEAEEIDKVSAELYIDNTKK